MIELTLVELAFVVIGLSMFFVVFFEWVSRWSNGNAERRGVRGRRVCRLCLAVFSKPDDEATAKCPECGALTDRRGPSALG